MVPTNVTDASDPEVGEYLGFHYSNLSVLGPRDILFGWSNVSSIDSQGSDLIFSLFSDTVEFWRSLYLEKPIYLIPSYLDAPNPSTNKKRCAFIGCAFVLLY